MLPSRPPSVLPIAVAVLFLAQPSPAQTSWTQYAGPAARADHALAFDSARGRTVLFSGANQGADTWEWDSVVWTKASPATSPSARSGHAMAYDVARARIVLFGGSALGALADTWEWNGTSWTQRAPTTSPPARSGHALAYDATRSRIVLFGGVGAGKLADTWEWDGTNWTQRGPATSPPARSSHALAYDSARQRTVLFGGQDTTNAYLADTWEWDGTSWAQRTPATSPSARWRHALAYDSARARTVLFAGGAPVWLGDTWEWDGTNWTLRSPATSPLGRRQHAMVFDAKRARTVCFGGNGATLSNLDDTWGWDGTSWTQLHPPLVAPTAREGHALAYEPSTFSTVMFGGADGNGTNLADTWTFANGTWTLVTPATSPPARWQTSAVNYGGLIVLFGGGTQGSLEYSDTWQWQGAIGKWTQRTPATSPPARRAHAMAADGARARIVLFGGRVRFTSQVFGDTWEFDGSTWLQRSPATSPSARFGAALAYDAARGRTVLFGGDDGASKLGDTWEWDGATWLQRTPATSPSARSLHALAYDSQSRRVVLFGGGGLGDTWEWDGTSWLQRTPPASPSGRDGHALAYDSQTGRMLLCGGSPPGPTLRPMESWSYAPNRPAAVLNLGTGCATPLLGSNQGSLPWIGDTFSALMTGIGPNPIQNVPFVVLGDSKTLWGALPLPLDLGVVGMPGCKLYVNWLIAITLANVGGTAIWNVAIPANASFVGASAYAQGVVTSPGTNPLGAVVSNGLELVFGSR